MERGAHVCQSTHGRLLSVWRGERMCAIALMEDCLKDLVLYFNCVNPD